MKDRSIQTIVTDWSDIKIRISYEANWLAMPSNRTAHFDIEAIEPERSPLPITETGYRSHFLNPEEVEAMGGPLPYVLAWLDAEARSPKWKTADMARRQYSLFS
jgi:hypothetical protein